MGEVIHHDFHYEVTKKELVAICPKCDTADWLLLLEHDERGLQRIVGYECSECSWRVDITPIPVVDSKEQH